MRCTLGAYQQRVDTRVARLAGAVHRVWQRDATLWGGDPARQRSVANRLGWLAVTSQMRRAVADIDAFAASVKAGGFTDIVLLGMGGSSLAPEVLRQSIADVERDDWPRLHVLDTTDPATILSVSETIEPARTLFCVSSKSGTTIEALSLFAYFHQLVERAHPGRAGDNFVAVTDAGTPLEALARQHGFRQVFTNPGDMGGRYSALSYFGLAPAALAGVDVGRLLDRGAAAATDARGAASDALRLGAALGELALAGRDKCTFIVPPGITAFGLWLEQLIAESTGKDGRGILPVAAEPPGVVESYGPDRLFVQLRLATEHNDEDDTRARALVAAGHPVISIDLADAYDLGGQFFTWEFAVAVVGHVLDINPFDEPNVTESKDNTDRVLRAFEASGVIEDPSDHGAGVGISAVGADGDRPSLEHALGGLFDAIGREGYLAVTAYVRPTPARQRAFDAVRSAVRDSRRVATTLGYGPRFLHSTGQLHKGGPSGGGFLQVTAADQRDIPIPGRSFTFGTLKRAQSIGDFQSLVSHGRPVVRLHLGEDIDEGLRLLVETTRAALGAPAGR